MSSATNRRKIVAAWLSFVLALTVIVFSNASPASADPECVNGGIYMVFARGSGEHFNDQRAHRFYFAMLDAIKTSSKPNMPTQWAEVGNIDGSVKGINMSDDPNYDNRPKPNSDDGNDYPAIGKYGEAALFWVYSDSVTKGTNELVTHLNDRVTRCPGESIVLGGYSQGADVIGWALQRSDLSATARSHIGYVALYGDPKFDPGSLSDRMNNTNFNDWWWVRGKGNGYHYKGSQPKEDTGYHGKRAPYVSNDFRGRFGSWCAVGDGICTGMFWEKKSLFEIYGFGTHSSAYQNTPNGTNWIQRSVGEITAWAILKRNQLNPGLLPATSAGYSVPMPDPNENPPVQNDPPTPTITQVKRTVDHTGIRQVYAATMSAVTEAWWNPGGEVHKKEMVYISQENIVGIDKVNEPDGTTQSLYTAVPDGVWETWWRPGDGPHHNKIVTGLNGVRQVIADPVWENGQYTHRLYLLAEDGPYEVWWRDGGDGIHTSRLDNISGPVTMEKSKGPDGTDQLYVATPTWVYELWWRPGTIVNHSAMVNVTQGNIRSLDKDLFGANGQLLYTGSSTTAWQSYWTPGVAPETHPVMQSQVNAIQIEKSVYDGVQQLYLATGDHVQEYWWRADGSNGTSTLIHISQNNITSMDKQNDGENQQVYVSSGDLVYETWWRGGSNPSGPNTSVLFKVAR